MKRIQQSLLGVLILTLLLTACAPAAPAAAPAEEAAASTEPVKGGVLVVARPADATLWDPKFTNDNNSLWAQHQVFATLVQNSADGTELKPWLAESWEINEDSSIFTFTLRDNAKFCNDTPITAEDVKFSLDRAMEEDSAVSWQFHWVSCHHHAQATWPLPFVAEQFY